MTTNSVPSSPQAPASRIGLTVGGVLIATLRVLTRTWPVIAVVYTATVVVCGVFLVIGLKIAATMASSADTIEGILVAFVAASVAISAVAMVPAAFFLSCVAAVTDSVINGGGSVRGVGRRVRNSVGSLLMYSLVVGFGFHVIIWIPVLIPMVTQSFGAVVFALLLSPFLGLGFTILVDLAPWIIVAENRRAFDALGVSTRLAMRSFGRLFVYHLVFVAVAVPLVLAVEYGGALGVLALIFALVVVVPASLSYLGVVYADLRARERGVTLVVPPGKASMTITAAFRDFVDGWKSPHAVGPTTSGGRPADGQGNEPPPVPLRPHPSMTFNPPPGWPQPPDPSTLVGGFRPEPTWPPAPERWEFWVPADQPGTTGSQPDGAPYSVDAQSATAGPGRTGDSAAMVAVPVIGLLVLAALGIGYLVNRQVEDAASSNSAGDYTYTETETPSYREDPDNPMANAIRGASVGDCVYKRSSGTTVLEFEIVDCSSGNANYIVTDTSTYTEYCPSSGTWTRKNADAYADEDVVLCLDRY